MGLSTALNNALSGMRVGQSGLDVLSRNVSNQGTPGYHRQSINVIDTLGVNSSYARTGAVTRAFNQSLQQYYTRSTAETGFANVRADFLDRLQTYFGKPGSAGSLDTAFTDLTNSLSSLATSPDDYASRLDALEKAGEMVATLNGLTSKIQGLRRETEGQMASNVANLNQMIGSLDTINDRLADTTIDLTTRASLLDQRDRLVSQVSEVIDIRTDYRSNDTVALMTKSGVGILDEEPSIFEFTSGGSLMASSLASSNPATNGVGELVLRTPGGVTLDLVSQNVLRSGEMAALIELRDKTLVDAQGQLDDVAAALAQAFSTQRTEGTPIAGGYEVDIAGIQNGNDVMLRYSQGGVEKSVRVVRVDDPTKLPLASPDGSGNQVVGLDFASPTFAADLGAALGPSFTVTTVGTTLGITGGAGVSMLGLTARSTVTNPQSGNLAVPLFVDANNADYTNSLDGVGQKLGFAGRIAINSAILNDSKLLVQYQAGGSLGDASRVEYVLDQVESMQFASDRQGSAAAGGFRLFGSVGEMISQTINSVGNQAAAAIDSKLTQAMTMETLDQRLEEEYEVDVDEEMGRLMELQNAFAANARVVSIVQELLDQLMAI